MIVTDLALKRRTSVLVLCFIIICLGIYSYSSLPRESAPDISIPNVFISTEYRGASPSDIENAITVPIENKLQGLEKVKKITSVSSEGLSAINIEFLTGADIDDMLEKVRNKVDEANPDLPLDLEEEPKVFEVNFSEFPILVLSLSGTESLARLKAIADDLADEIEGIPGVLEAEVSGGLEREIRVEPDPARLAYYRLPITCLADIIGTENRNVSGGAVRMGDGRFQLRVPGEFKTPEEIYGLVVGSHEGSPVYLKDIAAVIDGYKETTSSSRLNGHNAVNVAIKKRSGENVIQITDLIDRLVEQRKSYWPQGVVVTRLMDLSRDIRITVADLENNLVTGLFLVMLVIPFAMGFRNALLVGLAIPFSMLISFIVLYIADIALNNVVLFSLTLAVGMLVDNAIVIVENIFRFVEQGVPRREAARRATHEVVYPVIGSTATTLAAFMPLLPWPGLMGEFMRFLPITLIITLSSSLFVAVVINPVLSSIFMKETDGLRTSRNNGANLTSKEVLEAGESPVIVSGRLLQGYRRLLSSALEHRLLAVVMSLLMVLLMIELWLLRVGIEKPVEFWPSIDPNAAYINFEVPEGADLDLCNRLSRYAEVAVAGNNLFGPAGIRTITDDIYQDAMKIKPHELPDGSTLDGPSDLSNIKYLYTNITATAGIDLGMSQEAPNHIGIQFVDFVQRREGSPVTLDTIRQRILQIPGVAITVEERQDGPPTGAPINIEIVGEDVRILGHIAEKIKKQLEQIPFIQDIKDNFVPGSPAIQVDIDRQRAALLGLSSKAIGFALKVAFNGEQVSTYREGNEEYDITVQLSAESRQSTDVLRNLHIPAPSGNLVPLTTVAKISYVGQIGDIHRINRQRAVTVKANVDEERIPGAVAKNQAEKLLSSFPLPAGYNYRFTGQAEYQDESEQFLSRAFLVALFLILLILVTQFNSVMQPFIIIISVLLSLGGVFLGLAALELSFGIIMTGVGTISLAGVVVNNAIVLIDYTNQLRRRGLAAKEAVVAAGCTRFRPIFLTAITTILGLLPMVTGVSFDFHNMQLSLVSESSQWWRSMAAAVIFGLAFATVINLIVVPVLYSFVDSFVAFVKPSAIRKVKKGALSCAVGDDRP